MGLLSPSAISSMRSTMQRTLPGTCVIQRKSTVNVGGEPIDTWADLDLDVPCRIRPVSGGEAGLAGGRIVEESTHVLTLPAEQDIEEADRVFKGAVLYQPTLVRKRDEWELSRRVEVKEEV